MIKKYLSDFTSYLSGRTRYLPTPVTPNGFEYPIDLIFTLDDLAKYYEPFSEDGLPLKTYQSVGVQYNPTRIAAYGLALWNRYERFGWDSDRQEFLKVADWLCASGDGVWYYQFDWGQNKAPWISCMSQGEGISILVRAYTLTKEERYLEQALNAARVFDIPVGDGGVRSDLDGDVFFEEYPNGPSVHVLNGFLYSLIGLIELSITFPEFEQRAILKQAMEGVAKNIIRWDVDGWSAYDLNNEKHGFRNFATVDYHGLHVAQLKFIVRYCDNEKIKSCLARWERSLVDPKVRFRALFNKIVFRLLNRAQR